MASTNTALTVKEVDFNGDTLLAAQDNNGLVWVGVRWICDGVGLSQGQMQNERLKIKNDLALKTGERDFVLPTKSGSQSVNCLSLKLLPLWLAKISLTPKMQRDNPILVQKLLKYQLEAADILAAAFLEEKYTSQSNTYRQSDFDFDTFDFNGFFKGYVSHLVNQAMQPYVTSLSQGMSKIKNSIVNSRNELINGQKMIYNELRAHGTIQTEYIKSDIKDEIISLVKSIQSQQSDKFTADKEVLSYFYTQMRNVYGVVTEQIVKDYKQKYNINGRVSVLNAIVDDDNLASIYKNLLTDYLHSLQQEFSGFESDSDASSDIYHIESKAHITDSNRFVDDVENTTSTLSPFEQLVAKRNDKSMHGCATARMVYKHMEQLEDIDWTYHKSYYKRKNKLSKKAVFTKMDIIKSNKRLTELFEKSVLEMLKCEEVK